MQSERITASMGLTDEIRHSICELVNYSYASEEADYCHEGEPSGHVFEHIERISAWLMTPESGRDGIA